MGIGMDTGDNSPSEQQETFWGSAQAPESTTPTQPVPQTVSAPQGQIMGNLAQQPQTHFSATVSNSAQSGYNVSSPSITSDYDMSEKKKGMSWDQFAIGFFVPIAIMILLTVISDLGNGDYDESWDEVYKIEMITIFSDNGTFTHTFTEEVTDNGRFEVNWCYSMGEYEGYDYYCNERFSNGDVIIEIVERKNGGSEVAVGEYTGLNHTIWFTIDSHNTSEMDFEFEFYDRALQDELDYEYMDSGGDMTDTFFCLMPLVGIVAIVISFVKGNKSLGYGLITAASIPFVLGGFFLILLLMFGF
tara:strand:+ start:175 stop:1080 length:906 start_codon:yes stop_codon:yes gene_type:complete